MPSTAIQNIAWHGGQWLAWSWPCVLTLSSHWRLEAWLSSGNSDGQTHAGRFIACCNLPCSVGLMAKNNQMSCGHLWRSLSWKGHRESLSLSSVRFWSVPLQTLLSHSRWQGYTAPPHQTTHTSPHLAHQLYFPNLSHVKLAGNDLLWTIKSVLDSPSQTTLV